MSSRQNAARQQGTLGVSHVADVCRRYPGETVGFYTAVEVSGSLPGFDLRVTLPPGLLLQDYGVVEGPESLLPLITTDAGSHHLLWQVDGDKRLKERYEFRVEAVVAPPDPWSPRGLATAWTLESRAIATAEVRGEDLRAAESAEIAVETSAASLKYLPAIYRDDELMGRFLMLFESFWTPIDQQIAALSCYFDPFLTPAEFLPWLASWIDLLLDEQWPEDRRRMLLRAAVSLYRRRGTRQGLEEYLEIYTGHRPKIVEHRAHNFRLGAEARLGPGVALGTVNRPHSFTVNLRLPPIAGAKDKKERAARERDRRQRIETIVDAEKPAHTSYVLHIEELDA